MKNFFKTRFWIIGFVLIIGLSLSACDLLGEDDTPTSLSGTYYLEDDPFQSLTFSGSNTVRYRDIEYEIDETGTYSISDTRVTIRIQEQTQYFTIISSTTLRDSDGDYWRK